MLRYIYEHHDAVAQFVAQRTHVQRGFGACETMGVIDPAGKLIAGIVYHGYIPEAGIIEITAAALPKSRWLTRETIRRMYELPFEKFQCQMVVQLTPADDEALLEQLARGGYMFVRLPRILGRHRDGIVCQLTRETWEQSQFIRNRRHDLQQEQAIIERAA